MKLINKIAKKIGLIPYTLDDVISEIEKTKADDVVITAETIKYPPTE